MEGGKRQNSTLPNHKSTTNIGVARAKWTAIVLTCRTERNINAYLQEMQVRQDKGQIDRDVILLTVEDPKCEVGSGGATLNALLVVAEHISAKQGYTVVNSDVLNSSLILIVHMGRSYPFDACGRAFTALPLHGSSTDDSLIGLTCNLDMLLETLTTKLAAASSAGVWVCSSDMFLNVSSFIDASVFVGCDACLVTVLGSVDYATNHGVCKADASGFVEDILYRCKSVETLRACSTSPSGLVPLVSGVVYLSASVADRLLSCHVLPPLDSCTYMGLDSGATPICLSLFFDIMLALCAGMTKERFIERGLTSARDRAVDSNGCDDAVMRSARRLIWKQLTGFRMSACKSGFWRLNSLSLVYVLLLNVKGTNILCV
jgi:fucokinase